MNATSHDRNLLFGILAAQMDFISREALVAAMNAWSPAKDRPLGEILENQKALAPDRRALLEALVQEHLKQHGNDATKSLAAASSLGALEDDLRKISDPDVRASLLNIVAAQRAAERQAAPGEAVGRSTSSGVRFRILRPHARGGLGQVSVARDEELQREVALKEIQERHADDPDSRSRFLLEAEITGGLEHPGIVPVYGLGQYADGRPYYAMRFIRGDSLQEAVTRFHRSGNKQLDSGEGTLELRALLGRFIDVCNAMAYAHSRGVLHRDLKPGNIMLGQYGETLVVDWGLAKPQDPSDTRSASVEGPIRPSSGSGSSATLMGSAMGTPQYMSPEQAAGRLDLLGPASDVYSLGATLYCVLTGRSPMEGMSVQAALDKVQRGEFPHPRAINDRIARPLEAICLKAMALKPEDRYASPKDLADDVEHWLADEPVSAYREPFSARAARWARKHKTFVVSFVGLIVAAAVALAVTTVLVKQEQERTEKARQEAVAARQEADANARRAETARDQARRRYQMALDALNDMVFGIQTKLEVRPGTEDLRKDLLENARKGLQKLLQEAEKQGNPDQTLVWTYFRMGDVDQVLGHTQAAQKEYASGSEVASKLADADPQSSSAQSDLGISYINLGNIAQQLGQTQGALDAYHKALAIRERRAAAEPKDVKAQRGLSINYELLGDVTMHSSRTQDALDFYRKAAAIRQALADADAGNNQAQYDLSNVYQRMGDVTMQLGQPKEVIAFYQKVHAIRARLADGDPKNTQAQHNLSNIDERLGDAAERLGQAAEARDFYAKALAICETLAEADPKNALLQNDLSVSCERLGDVSMRLGEAKEALGYYQRVRAIRARLSEANPKSAEIERNLTISYDKLGLVSLRLGQTKEALDFYQKVLAIRLRLAEADPKNTQAQRDLGYSYEKLGDASLQSGDAKASLDYCRKALAIYERLAKADSKNASAQRDLQEGYYHSACALARLSASETENARERDAQQAIDILRQAVAKGFKDLERLKQGKDLEPLRAREDFKKLISDMEKPAAK